jgi:hypothetical protein
MTDIRDVVSQRTDLSTFLVHLTRSGDGEDAKSRLMSIIGATTPPTPALIRARSPFGFAKDAFAVGSPEWQLQRCVCFTETPLEYIKLLVGPIEGRAVPVEPYGVAITKKQGRRRGVNPVWYVDQTTGRDWHQSNAINALIDVAKQSGVFIGTPIAAIAPFAEPMGTWPTGRKEFWWEREWRYVGDFMLNMPYLLLCPEKHMPDFKNATETFAYRPAMVDPAWSLERIIAHLAGIPASDVEIL